MGKYEFTERTYVINLPKSQCQVLCPKPLFSGFGFRFLANLFYRLNSFRAIFDLLTEDLFISAFWEEGHLMGLGLFNIFRFQAKKTNRMAHYCLKN
jgi:hypothetical protein